VIMGNKIVISRSLRKMTIFIKKRYENLHGSLRLIKSSYFYVGGVSTDCPTTHLYYYYLINYNSAKPLYLVQTSALLYNSFINLHSRNLNYDPNFSVLKF